MNGIQLCAEVRKTSTIPFIIYTGHGSEEVASAAFAAGVDDYVRKEEVLAHYRVLARRIRHAVEKRQVEESLLRSEKQFKSLAGNAPDVIMRFDRDLRILYLNPQVEKATGIPPEKYLGKTNEEMGMLQDLCEIWNGMFRKALKTILVQEKEFLFPGPDGMRTYDLRVVPELGGRRRRCRRRSSTPEGGLGAWRRGVASGCWV
jgi:PAS domain S-box-containing protein